MEYYSENANRLTPYIAGFQPREAGWIKLNTNENPYPPSPRVMEALHRANAADLRLYPDGDSQNLAAAIAEELGVPAECIFLGNGSDEVLALAFAAFFRGKTEVFMPDISYGFYPVWAEFFDVGVKTLALSDDFRIDPDAYRGGRGVVLANPNAPTGAALGLGDIERIVRQNPQAVVLIDEAYIDFSNVDSAVELLGRYENLLVVRTFSKSHSLAGLRVGFAIGSAPLIAGLQRVKNAFNSYPLDMLAQIGAAAAIADRAYGESVRKRIMRSREKTAAALRELRYDVLDSQANFLLLRSREAAKLYQYLFDNKILLRYWNKARLSCWLRVSIGREEEMEAFLQCVKRF